MPQKEKGVPKNRNALKLRTILEINDFATLFAPRAAGT